VHAIARIGILISFVLAAPARAEDVTTPASNSDSVQATSANISPVEESSKGEVVLEWDAY
jgi:hypothetical protein